MRVLKDLLKKSDKSLSFKSRLASILMQYRSIPHSTTNTPPCVALNKRKLVTLRDRLNPKYCYHKTQQNVNDKKIHQFDVGDKVLALNLRPGVKWYSATIVERLGINIYNVKISDLGVVWRRHTNQLLPASSKQCTPESHLNPRLTTSVLPFDRADSNVIFDPDPIVLGSSAPSTAPVFCPVPETAVLRRSERMRKPVLRYGFDE